MCVTVLDAHTQFWEASVCSPVRKVKEWSAEGGASCPQVRTAAARRQWKMQPKPRFVCNLDSWSFLVSDLSGHYRILRLWDNIAEEMEIVYTKSFHLLL